MPETPPPQGESLGPTASETPSVPSQPVGVGASEESTTLAAGPNASSAAEQVDEAKPVPPEPVITHTDRPTVIVRYGAMGLLGRFICMLDPWSCGQRVVIKSDRGMEMGEIVCAWGGCGSPGGVTAQVRGEVIRVVTHVDEVEERHLRDSERREQAFCKKCIADRKLPMKLVAVEHLFGGDRIVFHFVSEQRVDFRALVRDLAHEFQTRIEMRQIGVRDEARLLGDYERCGRPLCCRAWIKELEPVSMKMAKVQKATLDPTKISGRCGRLMCCLRFEHTTYRDLAKNLPRKNTLVITTEGPGKVIDTDIVSQRVGVILNNGNRVNVPVESLRPQAEGAAPAESVTESSEETEKVERPVAESPPPPVAPKPQAETNGNRPSGRREEARPNAPPRQGPPADQGRPSGPGNSGNSANQGNQENRGRRGRRRSRRGRGQQRPGSPGQGPGQASPGGGSPPAAPSPPPVGPQGN